MPTIDVDRTHSTCLAQAVLSPCLIGCIGTTAVELDSLLVSELLEVGIQSRRVLAYGWAKEELLEQGKLLAAELHSHAAAMEDRSNERGINTCELDVAPCKTPEWLEACSTRSTSQDVVQASLEVVGSLGACDQSGAGAAASDLIELFGRAMHTSDSQLHTAPCRPQCCRNIT